MNQIRLMWNQVFSRILILYSIIIVVVVSLLILLLAHFFLKGFIDQALTANEHMVQKVEDYFVNRERLFSNNLQRMYYNSELLQSVTYALNNEPDRYWEYRLNNYADRGSFVPNNMHTFLNSFYYSDTEVDAIRIVSTEIESSYTYIFNHYNWNQMTEQSKKQNPEKEVDTFIKNGVTISKPVYESAAQNQIGNITAYYNSEKLNDYLVNYDLVGGIQVYTTEGRLLFSSIQDIASIPFPIDPTNGVYHKWSHNGEQYYLNSRTDNELGLTYLGIVPRSEIKGRFFTYSIFGSILFLIAVVTVLAGYFVMRRYARRIREIKRNMLKVQEGNLATRIDVGKEKDELATIAMNFNRMVSELETHIEQYYVLEMKKQQAEMRALQAQINPHFLYNTLETIRMKAIIEGAKEAAAMTYHLAKMLHYALSNKKEVRLKEELEHLKQYMKLMEFRYAETLTVHYKVDEHLLTMPILRFIIQPIAENFMKHGFKYDEQNILKVEIKQLSKSTITITIADNGNGIEAEKLKEIQSSLKSGDQHSDESIGLSNIHRRIQLYYGDPYGLVITSKEGHGTIVTLFIPYEGRGFLD